ncbi:neuromedin-U receptor 1 isoform X2 [Takifugu flavidus]|uniref:neuromedin-U receptor 1 isoform X2 n=1 Tax=Takifugu flavidus TaxID=433684 RepID=UPI0025446CA3|nr:neuromedin-U receptor 1 isoform X2 [Takifugu flavidus]
MTAQMETEVSLQDSLSNASSQFHNCSFSKNTSAHTILANSQLTEVNLVEILGPKRSPFFFPVASIYLLIFLVGLSGNFLTCTVIARRKKMRNPTNLYLLSLASSDILVLLFGMPLEIYELWQNYPFPFGEGGCYFKTFLFETVCFASILNVTALSVERYIAVLHPLKTSMLYLVMGLHLGREGRQSGRNLEGNDGNNIHGKITGNGRKTQVNKMLSMVVAVFGVCWAPFHIERLLWSSISHWTDLMHSVYQYVHVVSGFFFYLSSAVNPIIYSLLSTRFRESFREIMCSQTESRISTRGSPPFLKISLNRSVSGCRSQIQVEASKGLIPLLSVNVAQNAAAAIPTAIKEKTSEF